MGSTATPLDFTEFLEKYSVFVAKADFKFNAAHFVAYKGFRERLHGHNYTVGVRLEAEGIQADGYVVDFGDIKTVARRLCKALNELFLCPGQSDVLDIEIDQQKKTLQITCEDGAEFRFPLDDAVILPIKHSTVEELAHYLCAEIIEGFTMSRLIERHIRAIHITVAEAAGQEATYSRTIQRAGAAAGNPAAPHSEGVDVVSDSTGRKWRRVRSLESNLSAMANGGGAEAGQPSPKRVKQ